MNPSKITVEAEVSYLPSPVKLHDYAAGVMAAFGSVVEHIGALRGLPSAKPENLEAQLKKYWTATPLP